jgi:hypothetical protein
MEDGPKVAAAILAAEASRQHQHVREKLGGQIGGYDINAVLTNLYWDFLKETRKGERDTG